MIYANFRLQFSNDTILLGGVGLIDLRNKIPGRRWRYRIYAARNIKNGTAGL